MSGSDDREAFVTHHNYAECLASLLSGASLRYVPSLSQRPLPAVRQKENLIGLTKKSLEDEKQIVDLDEDYSYASTSWLPVKGYYLLFNLLLTIEYIIEPEIDAFMLPHSTCVGGFTKRLATGEIVFDNPILNEVFDGNIFQHSEKSGANLSKYLDEDRMFRMAMAKIADYKEDDWKRKRRIANFLARTDRERRDEFRKKFTCSVFEFPYYMRLRASYRDFAFIEGVATWETAGYFASYYRLIMAFCRLLEGLRDDLLKSRS